jgi:RNA polymerase sigma-70 factor (ECF subfamily)
VSRSGFVIAARIVAYPTVEQHSTNTFNILCIVVAQMDLGDPHTLRRVFEQHERGVHAAALRILGNPAQAQDVVQDVFLRIWRRPGAFDAHRGEIGSYLRMIARSRAVDLWREGQAAGRASDRLALVVEPEAPRVSKSPAAAAERADTRETVREALRRLPEAQREALGLA